MPDMNVTATEMRVYLKDFANMVASGGGAVVMSRHGMTMAVLIGYDEYQDFLRFKEAKRKPQPQPLPPPEPPEELPLEVVERIYRDTEDADDEGTRNWRARAYVSLIARKRDTGPPS